MTKAAYGFFHLFLLCKPCANVSHYILKNDRQRHRCIISFRLVYSQASKKPLNVGTRVSLDGLNQCREKDAALAPVGYASISLDGARNQRYQL